MYAEIKKLIDEEINPKLQLQTAHCELVSIDAKNVVTLKIVGGCSGCPSSTVMLFNIVIPKLKSKFPQILDVVLA